MSTERRELLKPADDCGHLDASEWVARARRLAPLIEAEAGRIERDGKVPAEVMAALHDAQLFRMCLPRSLGGGEATMLAIVGVLEEVAAADASTAWCLGQGLGCSLSAAYVDRAAALDVFGPPDAVLAWGPTHGGSKAVVADGGFRITGAWRFASGSRNATWLGAHCPVYEDDETPRLDANGRPVFRTVMFPYEKATVTDVWQVIGLKGTGSDDYAVTNVFVPEAYTFTRDGAADRREPGPLYRFPLTTFYGMGFAGVALGIARATLRAFIAFAADKVPGGTTTVLREHAAVQLQVAQAEARLGAGRAFLVEMVGKAWEAGFDPESFPIEQRARLRIACSYAIHQARDVVEFAYRSAGSDAIFESNPFERRFRDMNTVAQQIQASPSNFEQAGQVLLGLTPVGNRI